MSLVLAFDASNPPQSAPPGCTAVFGYLGGNTPHVWEEGEWARFASLAQTGIWVADPNDSPAASAAACIGRLQHLGWARYRPFRRAVMCDLETLVDPGWLNVFALAIWDAGYETWPYGSLSTITKMAQKEGIIAADWDGIENIPPGANIIGHQYRADVPFGGTLVDYTVLEESALTHMGYGPRT